MSDRLKEYFDFGGLCVSSYNDSKDFLGISLNGGANMSDESPIIAEVRRVRHKIAEECGYDLRKITERARDCARRILEKRRLQSSQSRVMVQYCTNP